MQEILTAQPRQFYAGCAAARDGESNDANPYTGKTYARAWSAGWLSVREGWTAALDHT
jgi:ribosome modulation factor